MQNGKPKSELMKACEELNSKILELLNQAIKGIIKYFN